MTSEKLLVSDNGAYKIWGTYGAATYGVYFSHVGDDISYGDGWTVTTRGVYWGVPYSPKAYPGDDGVTVYSFAIHAYATDAYSASLMGGQVSGTVYVCVPDTPLDPAGDAQEIYEKANNAEVIGACPTGESTVLNVSDTAMMEKILKNGVVLRAAQTGWRASAGLAYIDYVYTNAYEAPTVSFVSAPSSAFLCDDIPLSWTYSQSADVPQSKVDIAVFRDNKEYADYMAAEGLALSAQQYNASLRDTEIFYPELLPETVWRIGVRAYSEKSDTPSAWSLSSPIKLKDLLAVLLSPIGGVNVFSTDDIKLTWKYKEAPAGNPYKFSVGWSTNGGESWTTKEVLYADAERDGDTFLYTIPADTIPHGVVKWYALVYTTRESYNPFQAIETFTAVIQASTSAVTCDGKPLPTLTWESNSQAAFQVRFADYDSGAVYGDAQSFRVPYIYEDGLYAVQVRTQTTAGDWSEWSETQYVQITNIPPDNDFGYERFQAQKTARAVRLDCIFWGDYRAYVFYRDGVPIYCGEDGGYTDTAANGTAEYTARAVTADGYYFEFEKITIDTTPDVDCLYDVAAGEWMSLVYSSQRRRRNYSQTGRVTYRYYSGRTKPVAFTEGYTERSGSFSYCFRRTEDARRLETMAGKEVLYKGRDGSMIRGILNGVTTVSELLHDMSFTVTEIDFDERVPYEIEIE